MTRARQTHRPLTVVALLLALFMAAMEATVVVTALPTVVAELHGLELYGWVSASYMLAMTVTIPLWGKLADQWGRKPTLLIGLVVFLVGSVACGFAPSMTALIVFRALQGVGAGALQPVTLTVIGDLFTLEERSRIQGVFGAVWGFAAIVGPLLGGAIVRVASWRWAFFVNVAPCVLSAWLLVGFYAHARPKADAIGRSELDWLGALLLTVCIMSVLAAAAGFFTLVMLPIAIVALLSFLRTEQRALEPILPLSLFSVPAIAGSSICAALMGGVMTGLITYTPLFAQAARQATPTEAGATIAPMLVGWPIASAISGRILPRIGYRPLVRAGLSVVAVATVAAYEIVAHGASLSALRGAMFAFGAGMGLANTALLIAVQQSVELRERGVATASAIFFRQMGGAVAAGALSVLLAHAVGPQVPADVLSRLLGPERGRGLDPSTLSMTSSAIAHGMQPIFVVAMVLGAMSAIAGWMFPQVSIERRSEVEVAGE